MHGDTQALFSLLLLLWQPYPSLILHCTEQSSLLGRGGSQSWKGRTVGSRCSLRPWSDALLPWDEILHSWLCVVFVLSHCSQAFFTWTRKMFPKMLKKIVSNNYFFLMLWMLGFLYDLFVYWDCKWRRVLLYWEEELPCLLSLQFLEFIKCKSVSEGFCRGMLSLKDSPKHPKPSQSRKKITFLSTVFSTILRQLLFWDQPSYFLRQ